MRFNSVCLITDDVLSLTSFYQKVLRVQTEVDCDYAKILVDGTDFTVFSRSAMEKMAPYSFENVGSGSIIIEIEVDDVDKEYERLQNLDVKLIKPPTTQTWGIRSVWFADPDGNIINFYKNVGVSL